MQLNDIIIVLSRPAQAGNVGSVCRAMKNMGLSRLRLAAPELKPSRFSTTDETETMAVDDTADTTVVPFGTISEAGLEYGGNLVVIKARAVHAGDIWENAQTFDTLEAAVKDCSLVIGTTRRRGRHRKQITMTPCEIAAFLKDRPGPAAIVFGNERTGLEDDELELCNIASHIPTDDIFPSLNLSHAVMIYTYELFQALSNVEQLTAKGEWVPMDKQTIDKLVNELTDRLKTFGFYQKPGREEQERFFRDVFARSGLTEREALYFINTVAKAVRLGDAHNAAHMPS